MRYSVALLSVLLLFTATLLPAVPRVWADEDAEDESDVASAASGGLTGRYYDRPDFTDFKFARLDPLVDFNWGIGSPGSAIGPNTFSIQWSGWVRVNRSETYTFSTVSDDGVRLRINGQLLINNWTVHPPTENSGSIALQAGRWYPIVLRYYDAGGGARIQLFYSSANTPKQLVPSSNLRPDGGSPNNGPPNAAGRSPVQLSMFYHPPRDGTGVGILAQRFSSVIFIRGDEAYRNQLRRNGFRGPAFQYLLANEALGPAGLRSSADPCGSYTPLPTTLSGIAGDFCSALHGDEQNFLHNGRGERLYRVEPWENGSPKTVTLYLMNPAAPGWQAYVAQRLPQQGSRIGYTGVFLDNIDLTLHRGKAFESNADGTVREFATDAAYRQAVTWFLGAIRRVLPAEVLWASLTSGDDTVNEWDPYIPYLDGFFSEYFVARWFGTVATPATWEVQMKQAEKVLSRGKAYTMVAQGGQHDVNRMRFALASYLLVTTPMAHFRYAEVENYHQVWLYDDYQAALGTPSGKRYRWQGLWRRDFACGYVTVNPAAKTGQIVVDPARGSCR